MGDRLPVKRNIALIATVRLLGRSTADGVYDAIHVSLWDEVVIPTRAQGNVERGLSVDGQHVAGDLGDVGSCHIEVVRCVSRLKTQPSIGERKDSGLVVPVPTTEVHRPSEVMVHGPSLGLFFLPLHPVSSANLHGDAGRDCLSIRAYGAQDDVS